MKYKQHLLEKTKSNVPAFRSINLESSSRQLNSLAILQVPALLLPLWKFLRELKRPSNIWFIFIVIISSLSSSSSQLSPLIHAIPLTILLILKYLKLRKSFSSHSLFEESLNNSKYLTFEPPSFISKSSKSLQEGDIFLLNQNDTVPCDSILISLDVFSEKLLIHLSELDNSGELEKKNPLKETHNLLTQEGLTVQQLLNLIDSVKVSQPQVCFESVSGKVKIKGCPTAAQVRYKNFLRAGSKIVSNSNAVCLAVYVGIEAKKWLDYRLENRKVAFVFNSFEGFFEIVLTAFAIFFICLQIGFLGIFRNFESEEVFIGIFSLFGVFPVFYFGFSEGWRNFQAVKVSDGEINVGNFESLLKVANVEYVLAEKSGVLTENEVKVQICQVLGQFYSIFNDSEVDPSSYKESEAEELQIPEVKTENYFKKQPFSALRKELLLKTFDSEVWIFCIAALISVDYYSIPPHFKNPADKAISEFFSDLGLILTEKTSKYAKISFNSSEIIINIIASSQNPKKTEKNLLISTDPDTFFIISCFSDSQKTSLSQKSQKKQSFIPFNLKEFPELQVFPGLCSRYYFYQNLSPFQADSFKSAYESAQNLMVNKKHRISELFKNFSSLSELGSLNYENLPSKESENFLTFLIESDINIWIASYESEESLKATAITLNLLKNESEVYSFTEFLDSKTAYQAAHQVLTKKMIDTGSDMDNNENFGRIDEVFSTLRESRAGLMIHPLLKDLGLTHDTVLDHRVERKAEEFKSNNDFFVFISGPVLKMAFSDSDLLREIVVLAFLAKRCFFCRMFPEQKRRLVKIIQENFEFKPKVMALAASEGSFKMIAEAEVGVRLFNGSIQKESFFSDFSVSRLEKVTDLIVKGREMMQKHQRFTRMTGFYVSCHTTAVFLTQVNNRFKGTPVEIWMILLFYAFAAVFSGVASGLARNHSEKKESFFRFRDKKVLIVLMLVSGVIHGSLIFYFNENLLRTLIDSSGKTFSVDDLFFTIHVQCSFALVMQSFSSNLSIMKKIFLFIFAFSLIFVTSAVIIASKTENLDFSLFFSLTFWLFLLFFTFFSGLLSTMIKFLSNLHQVPSSRLSRYSKNLLKVFKNDVKWKCSLKDINFKLDKKTMTFKNLTMENEFMFSCFQSIKVHLRIYLGLLLVIHGLGLLLFELGVRNQMNLGRFLLIPAAFYSFLMFLTFTVKTEDFRVVECSFFISLSALLIYRPLSNPELPSQAVFPILFLMFAYDLHTRWKYSIMKSLLLFFISLFSINYELFQTSTSYHFTHSNSSNIATHSVFWTIIMLFTGLSILSASYFKDLHRRTEFIFEKQLSLEVEKSSTILTYLLPNFLQKKVKSGIPYFLQTTGNLSVIFVEICDFDDIVKIHDPFELTALLDLVFSRIDFICKSSGVCKIETVGKTYMAAAGLKDGEEGFDWEILNVSHVRRAVEMALAVIQESHKMKLKSGKKVRFKIGINSGPVTAGVVGYHKPQFSLVGDTVNTASRMASTLEDWDSVQISRNAFELLDDLKGLAFRDSRVLVKGKGMMDTKIVSYFNEGDEKSLFEGHRNSSRRDSTGKSFQVRGSNRKRAIMASLDIENSTELERRQSNFYSKDFFYICRETEEEKEFRESFFQEIQKKQRIGLVLTFVADTMLMICEIFLLGFNAAEKSKTRLAVQFFGNLMIFFCFFQKKITRSQYFCYFLSFLYSSEIAGYFISLWFSESECLVYMFFFYKFTFLSFFTGTLFKKSVFFNGFSVVLWSFALFKSEFTISDMVLTAAFVFCTWYSVYQEEGKMRTNSILKRLADQEINKNYELLSQMMPPKALENLQEGVQVIDRVSQVTVMYADIVGFTQWSASRGSAEVVSMLGQLFTEFDQLCVKHSVYKVHTIGDCYVAMGFRSEKSRNPQKEAENVVRFALDIVDVVRKVNNENGFELAMRIGIHSGEVIGGITGTNVVRYDIYGPDVLIANKMESFGKAGSVSVSEKTKNLMDCEEFEFEESGEFFISSLQVLIRTFVVWIKDKR